MDFVDMLINTFKVTNLPEWSKKFSNKYDHIFIDEYQDTSALQMKICLAMNAKQYYLIGDVNQQIFQFTGVSECDEVEELLTDLHVVEKMTLSTNFRCKPNVVAYSNRYSKINARSAHNTMSLIDESFLTMYSIKNIIERGLDLTFLARTNKQLRELETQLISNKVIFNYQYIVTDEDLSLYHKGRLSMRKEIALKYYAKNYESLDEMLIFMYKHKDSKSKCMTIHKAKGSEFDNCVLVNNFNQDVLETNSLVLDKKELKKLSVTDLESSNIHNVALTRSKNDIYFLNIEI
jgi:superfamily I DNA/RNA helicase